MGSKRMRETIRATTSNVLASAKDTAYASEKHCRRMRIVAWLRAQGFTIAAEAIENGEHLR